MSVSRGIKRLRDSILIQDLTGQPRYTLSFGDAYELLTEVEEEAGRVCEAERELTALKIDLEWTDDTPLHYRGDGKVPCQRAMLSMSRGWAAADTEPPFISMFWVMTAFKYLWRFPLKGEPRKNLIKALDCAQKALDTLGEEQG